jgi:hypothetical protein
MSIPVDLAVLGETLRAFDYAYLVTITEGSTAHVVAVSPVVRGDKVEIDGLGRRTLSNAGERPAVTLAWPPRVPGGYSQIVDGTAETAGVGLAVSPSRAVLHRAAPEREPKEGDGCASDCVEVPLAGAS